MRNAILSPPMQGYRMRLLHRHSYGFAIAAMCALLSCNDATSPQTRADGDPRLLHVTYDAPALATTQASFYAVKGQAAGVDIWYHARPGRTDSLKFLAFRMGPSSLDRRPDGSVIAPGDSVLITLSVTDPTHLKIESEPSGLRFASSDPPTLRLFWVACGEDLNYDGVVDANDAAIAQQLSIWRQEGAGQPWLKVSSVADPGLKQVSAPLSGFTGYAISY